MNELNPISVQFNVPRLKNESQEMKSLLQKQSNEHTALLKKQEEEEKKYGANIGAIRAKSLKEHTTLAKQQDIELANFRKQTAEKSASDLKAVEDRLNAARGEGLNKIRQQIFNLEEQKRKMALGTAYQIEGAETKQHKQRVAQINAELQLTRTLEKEKIGRTFSEQLEKNGLGGLRGGLGQAAALFGGTFSVVEIIKMGEAAARIDAQMKSAFQTAGATAQQASSYAKRATLDAEEWGQKIGITTVQYKELARQAAFTGGFLGDMNKQLVVAAAAIEKQTSGGGEQGSVTASRFIRGISMGFNSDEGSQVLGRLRMSMPMLAAELSNATDKEDLFKKAISFANESVKAQIEWMKTDEAAIERNTVKRQNQIEHLGITMNKWLGGILNFANTANVALDTFFGTLDAKDAEEHKIIEQKITDLKAIKKQILDNQGIGAEAVQSRIDEYEREIKAADKSSDATALHEAKLAKEKVQASEAAQKIGFLADEYNSLKDSLDKLDNRGSRIDMLVKQAAVEEQKLLNGEGNVWTKYFLAETDKQIEKESAKNAQFNKLVAKHSKHDLRQDNTAGKTKTGNAKNPMESEQTRFELAGIKLNYTKEQIEIGLLQIQIKYDYLLASKQKAGSDLRVKYELEAAHAIERLREVEAAQEKQGEEKERKIKEVDFQFRLSTASEFDRKRMELNRKFEAEVQNAEWESLTLIGKMYSDAWDKINKDEEEKLFKPMLERRKKYREILKREKDKEQKETEKAAKDAAHELQSAFDSAGSTVFNNVFKPIEESLKRDKSLIADLGSELLKLGEKKLLSLISNELFPDETKEEKKKKEQEKYKNPVTGAIGGFRHEAVIDSAAINITTASLTINGLSNSSVGADGKINGSVGLGSTDPLSEEKGFSMRGLTSSQLDKMKHYGESNYTDPHDSTGFFGGFEQPKLTIRGSNAPTQKDDPIWKRKIGNGSGAPDGEITQGEEKKNIVELGLIAEKIHTTAEIVMGMGSHLNLPLIAATNIYETVKNHEQYKKDPNSIIESPIEKTLRQQKEGTYTGGDNGMQIQHPQLTPPAKGDSDNDKAKPVEAGVTAAFQKLQGKGNNGKPDAKGALKSGLSAAAGAAIPGGGIIVDLLGSVLGLSHGGRGYQYFASGGSPRGKDTVHAMISPEEKVLTPAETNHYEKMMRYGSPSNSQTTTSQQDLSQMHSTMRESNKLLKQIAEKNFNGNPYDARTSQVQNLNERMGGRF